MNSMEAETLCSSANQCGHKLQDGICNWLWLLIFKFVHVHSALSPPRSTQLSYLAPCAPNLSLTIIVASLLFASALSHWFPLVVSGAAFVAQERIKQTLPTWLHSCFRYCLHLKSLYLKCMWCCNTSFHSFIQIAEHLLFPLFPSVFHKSQTWKISSLLACYCTLFVVHIIVIF